ncbi:MAG: thioredoxin domain-containing protein [Acidobacteria bacterium]|nr:thioredoxin domain-containing protein [Acidobacteriota bacterium]
MRSILICIVILFGALAVSAQSATEVLATSTIRSFTAQDLSPDISQAWIALPKTMANAQKALLDRQIDHVLLEVAAAENKTDIDQLIENSVDKKVPDPSEARIKEVYEANKADLENMTLDQVRPKIVEYLRQEPEKKAYQEFVAELKNKYKITFVKDIAAPKLIPADVLATVGPRTITYKDFSDRNALVLYEYEANVYDEVLAALNQSVEAALLTEEAMGYGIAPSDLIAREITNKMRDYSDEEQERLHSILTKRLYEKYRVRFFLKAPDPFVQNISVDDDPSEGDKNAPVTVVMFTDLQCPACAAVDPILKKVIAEYGARVRFVVRDFPLEGIHENAFAAAVAANAANQQGKFFEYKELLYKNQDSLDTESLVRYPKQIGLDEKRFRADLNDKKYAEEVRHDIEDGEKYGVNSTPTIFVNGIKVRVLSAQAFREAIDRFAK